MLLSWIALVTCLLQSITDCFRCCKIIKKSLLHLDIGGHGDRSMKLFGSQECFYDGQSPFSFKKGKTRTMSETLFNFTNKDTRPTLMTPFYCLYCYL